MPEGSKAGSDWSDDSREAKIRAVLEEQIAKATSTNPNVENEALDLWEKVAPTARSKGRPIRPSKPKDGRAAYVWRMLRFHLGEDTHLPVMADTYIPDELGEGVSYWDLSDEEKRTLHENRRAEMKRLDAVVDFILATRFPLSQFNGARVWGRAFYGSGF